MSDVLHKEKLEEAYELLKGSDPRWVNTILRMTRMAAGKGKDYGNDEDNLANLTACKSMGIEPWVGVTIRMRDKEQRIDSFLTTGELENESLEDAIWDSAVYGAHRATLYEEGCVSVPPTPWVKGSYHVWEGAHWDHRFTRWRGVQDYYGDDIEDDAEYWWPKWHEAGCP